MLVTSLGILKIENISCFVHEPVHYYLGIDHHNEKSIVGWGRKKSFFKAQNFASKHNLQVVCLEDGFIRSLGLGKEGYSPLSLVVDCSGIYFDATQTSDLEQLITLSEDQACNDRAKRVIAKILDLGLTKYNQKFSDITPLDPHTSHILVIDQTFEDQSIAYAGATASTFQFMLDTALAQHPDAIIWVKTHPDVLAGKAQGHFCPKQLQHPRIRLVTQAVHPHKLLQYMQHVYVVSSHMGFEALLYGKIVHCFGVPWYAGWGLTDDQYAPINILQDRRQQRRSIEHLFACAYFAYARYISPISKQSCELEEIIALLEPNVRLQQKLASEIICYGFSRWKQQFIRDFLHYPNTKLQFMNWTKPKVDDVIFAWGKKAKMLKAESYKCVTTVEDGFIRSSGLGANLTRPYSLVFDDVGIYYDATQPSKLEYILNSLDLTALQYERAKNVIAQLKQLNITKYNVGDRRELSRSQHAERVILVTGQVEDDLSVQLGGVSIKTNLALLQKVRELHPAAYIIYKPHPDVHAGLRVGTISEEVIAQYANDLILDASILECFDICDEVHTITSLSGFEALLRGLKVYCYGLPFYAGWGLTTDLEQCSRRRHQLSLEELVYGVLIDYACYNLPITKKAKIAQVNIEDVIKHIAWEQQQGISSPILQSTFAKIRAKILYGKVFK